MEIDVLSESRTITCWNFMKKFEKKIEELSNLDIDDKEWDVLDIDENEI